MYKITCKTKNCENKEQTYYIIEPTDPTMCGGCKQGIVPVEMSQAEFDEVFDYDPFASPSTGLE
jgi:hypothetical protein